MVYQFSKILWIYPVSRLCLGRIKGMENIPKKGNFIVVANHNHFLDPGGVLYPILRKLNRKVHFVASPRYIPYLGKKLIEQWAGCILRYKGIYDKVKKVILSGEIVAIFPEGLLYDNIKDYNYGAIKLAFETSVPILPIGIKGSYIPLNSRVHIGELIHIKNKKNLKKQMKVLMDKIYDLKNN